MPHEVCVLLQRLGIVWLTFVAKGCHAFCEVGAGAHAIAKGLVQGLACQCLFRHRSTDLLFYGLYGRWAVGGNRFGRF